MVLAKPCFSEAWGSGSYDVRCVGGMLLVEKNGVCSVAPFAAKKSFVLPGNISALERKICERTRVIHLLNLASMLLVGLAAVVFDDRGLLGVSSGKVSVYYGRVAYVFGHLDGYSEVAVPDQCIQWKDKRGRGSNCGVSWETGTG
jgi:hypothetical protein